ncbi:Pex19 protein [Ramaria rubella]|nr:Pex19 protein [Ramaria rubella]
MSNGKFKAEEDLDDLDDVLEHFTKPEPPPQQPKPPALSEEFGKQLAAEMEAMMRAMSGDGQVDEAFPAGSDNSKEGDDPFQKVIRQAMEKLKDSDDTMKADSKTGQDDLESLLASLGDMKLGEDGAEDGENLESMLETMMSQLMSKDILYEPLKELDTKYPEYLAEHSSSLSPEELSRYTDQKARVTQIVSIFENPSYSDDNVAQSTEILRLMNEVQSYGSPPSEIMGAIPPGFDFGTDGMPKLPDGCIIL